MSVGSTTTSTTTRGAARGAQEAGAAPGERSVELRRTLGRADLRAVPETRRAVRELLRHWGGPGRSEIAELLTSELVTNALVHTDREAEVTATVRPDGLRVEVRDYVSRRPEPNVPPAEDGTHGRGLFLVESLADAWGVSVPGTGAPGKVVWFELTGDAA
ncbi:ATP-binding protein [Streptomyces sp. SID5785]|uniref:ATP-binding protein n=1 Tax=Streptomyces sp. SID5785 TaxID=2690309 RepID=UPI001F1FEBDE|nr:ATP-binding protein [Streptomyces sp. SID5785]